MNVLGFNENGDVVVSIGGLELVVPNDPGNRHRQMITEWEAAGNTIPAYAPPITDGLPNLEPDQFWFVVRAAGYEPDLRAWVASMNDPASPTYNPVEWAQASAKLEFAKFFERDHPFVEAAREAIGLAPGELDALWAFGAA